MEWKKDPSDDALEKSGRRDGYGNNASREARDFSNGDNRHDENQGGKVASHEGHPRRRRRISEMNNNQESNYRNGSNNYQKLSRNEYASFDRPGDAGFNNDYGRNKEEHNFYKEKYNQVRETNRSRYVNNPERGQDEFGNNNHKDNRADYQERRPRNNSDRGGYPVGRGGYQSDRREFQSRDDYQPSRRPHQLNGEESTFDRNSNSNRGLYQQNRRRNQPYNRDWESDRSGSQGRGGRGGNPQQSRGYQKNSNRDDNRRPNNRPSYNKGDQQRVRTAPIYDVEPFEADEKIRLNKFLSNSGVCSRREADELIKAGAVLVNGVPVTEMGVKITIDDRVEINGREIKPENKVYVLLNKPRNCVTTTDDPQERLTVINLVRKACKERIYPVGRLDRNTTGVLLLTNDGELASKLVHPSFKKKKIYHVWLDKEVSVEDMQAIANGIELEDGEMHADAISYAVEDDHTQVGIEIHSGRNRIVRRIFEHLGYHVTKLDRVYFAGLTKKNLGRGKWRYLTQEEVDNLKMGAFE
ncbi:pseudouridine synthase [Porphyromonadaceae bacterium W3.11]|nr:pseudouridine synthase [Porphyromonadaceae bacterium W3.11]